MSASNKNGRLRTNLDQQHLGRRHQKTNGIREERINQRAATLKQTLTEKIPSALLF